MNLSISSKSFFVYWVCILSSLSHWDTTELQDRNASQTLKIFSAKEFISPDAPQISTVYFTADFKITSSGIERPLQTRRLILLGCYQPVRRCNFTFK